MTSWRGNRRGRPSPRSRRSNRRSREPRRARQNLRRPPERGAGPRGVRRKLLAPMPQSSPRPASRASPPPIWQCGRFRLDYSCPLLMGVVNVTPDSFSDGGRFLDPQQAIAHAWRLIEEGADLIDIGGESTRPGAQPVDAAEELRRGGAPPRAFAAAR